MAFTVRPELKTRILQQYDLNMIHYPKKREEVEAFLQGREEAICLCLRFLYGHLPANDLLSFPVQMLAGYAEASLEAYEIIDYIKTIPQELFFTYVLYHRVNSECLDGSRGFLMATLLPHVQGKTMAQAALAVNAWCFSQATYTPADDRTLGPLAVMRRTLGRCGEESVLAVAALRSVGIPARQCYCPRWSHCDDNHAWVEVWTDGEWHYLGACEPEPVLDKGWFTSAASRAMLVHTKQWSCFDLGETVLQTAPTYREVSVTERYADLKLLTVQILRQGKPLEGVTVSFQIVNYSQFFTLHKACTDAQGVAQFATGLGDLCVYVCHDGKLLLKKVDMRLQQDVMLDLDEGQSLAALDARMELDLVPPIGESDVAARTDDPAHEELLRSCVEQRERYQATFAKPEGHSVFDSALREAAGNWQEVAAFIADERYTIPEKEELLRTLRPKDFVDITYQTLCDALDTALPVKNQYPADVYQKYILAPRIADEMLLPQRAKIRQLFPEGFANPAEILAWLQGNMQIVDAWGADHYEAGAYGCLRYRQVPAHSYDLVFVSLCRAFRFPACLAPDTRKGQWLDEEGKWQTIHDQKARVGLTLKNPTGTQLRYQEHFALERFHDGEFVALSYPDLVLGQICTLQVEPGLYRLITTTRQIDGTASVILLHPTVEQDMCITLELPADQTVQRLRQVPLQLPAGPVQQTLAEVAGRQSMLIFADPGSEPTEHLLQEMLECAQGFVAAGFPIRIFMERLEMVKNATLQRVQAMLPMVQTLVCRDPEGEAALHRQMQVGDLRLPFVIAVDAVGRGIYASANYNIRTAQNHLRIQKLIQGGQ